MKQSYRDPDFDALIRGMCEGKPSKCRYLGRTCSHCIARDFRRLISGGRKFWI